MVFNMKMATLVLVYTLHNRMNLSKKLFVSRLF